MNIFVTGECLVMFRKGEEAQGFSPAKMIQDGEIHAVLHHIPLYIGQGFCVVGCGHICRVPLVRGKENALCCGCSSAVVGYCAVCFARREREVKKP